MPLTKAVNTAGGAGNGRMTWYHLKDLRRCLVSLVPGERDLDWRVEFRSSAMDMGLISYTEVTFFSLLQPNFLSIPRNLWLETIS